VIASPRKSAPGANYLKRRWRRHGYRTLGKQFGLLFGIDKVYEEIYSKHFKKQYNGKPTKRYLKLLKQVEAYEENSDNYLQLYRALKV